MENSNYSVTQTTNLTAIIGVIVMVLNHFNINIGSEELTAVAGALITVFSIFFNWYNRFLKGDVTVGGKRKY